jgi:hypothetical protein
MLPAKVLELTHSLVLRLLVLTMNWPAHLHKCLMNKELQQVTGHLPAQLRSRLQLLLQLSALQHCCLLFQPPAADQQLVPLVA